MGGETAVLGPGPVKPTVSASPPSTTAAPASSGTVGVSLRHSQADAIPTTGTSSVNGATVEAGCRPSSQAHAPKPISVESPTT